jgi:hypothetical protein
LVRLTSFSSSSSASAPPICTSRHALSLSLLSFSLSLLLLQCRRCWPLVACSCAPDWILSVLFLLVAWDILASAPPPAVCYAHGLACLMSSSSWLLCVIYPFVGITNLHFPWTINVLLSFTLLFHPSCLPKLPSLVPPCEFVRSSFMEMFGLHGSCFASFLCPPFSSPLHPLLFPYVLLLKTPLIAPDITIGHGEMGDEQW